MDDFERELQRSLTTIRDDSSDEYRRTTWEARAEALDRIRRRRARRYVATGAVAAAAVAVTLYVAARPTELDRTGELPLTGTPSVTADPDLLVPITVTPVGNEPRDLSVGGRGRIWTANADGTVSRIDKDAPEATTFDVTSTPGDIAIANGPVWVALPEDGAVVEIEPEVGPGEPIEIFDEAVDRMELTVGDGVLWVVSRGEALIALDVASGTSQSVDVPGAPIDVAIHGQQSWVLTEEGTVLPIDQGSLTTGSGFPVPPSAGGDLTYAGESLWYFTGESDELIRLDPATGDLSPTSFDGDVIDLAIDPRVAWVLLRRDDSSWLQPVDRITGEATGEARPIDGFASEVAIAHGSLWVTLTDRAAVARFPKG